VHESDVNDKHRYINLVRAQLSQNEQLLLFTHGIHQRGRNKWWLFIEEYALLFELRLPEAIAPLTPIYSPRAFGLPAGVEWTAGHGWTTPLKVSL
jgi:hypothetical protein